MDMLQKSRAEEFSAPIGHFDPIGKQTSFFSKPATSMIYSHKLAFIAKQLLGRVFSQKPTKHPSNPQLTYGVNLTPPLNSQCYGVGK